MKPIGYRALVIEEVDGKFIHSIKSLSTNILALGNVLIRVHYSSVNYKDALSYSGNKGVTKNYPHIPGIDAAGVVEASESPLFNVGDEVIVMGYDLGMNTAGGYAQYITVPDSWIVKCPRGLTLKETMIIGTAGFTSALSVNEITRLVKPSDGKIIVSGATGGVGSVALMLLEKLGYYAVAVSGKESEADFLAFLGAKEIISRAEFEQVEKRPLLSAQYAGGIDTVGGPILENILKTVMQYGIVTTCGSVSSTNLNLTVFPFILRGITLVGISAQNSLMHVREEIWKKLSTDWKSDKIHQMFTEVSLVELPGTLDLILTGKLKGRTIVKLL